MKIVIIVTAGLVAMLSVAAAADLPRKEPPPPAAAPAIECRRLVLLIDIVGRGRDARAAALGRCTFALGSKCRAFGGPVKRVAPWVERPGGKAQDEHESLILAQNERWRHA